MDTLDTLNRPLRDLRISVIDACNFRCSYCMPIDRYGDDYPFMKATEILSWEQLLIIVQVASVLGVKKIRLTGGEPLLRKGIDGFIASIKKHTTIEEIALTTNGYYLEENALALRQAGLDRLTVSLDTLDPDKAYFINGKKDILPKILSGLEVASQSGFKKIKINTVLQKNVNDDEILDLIEYFRNKPFIVRFIEFMDVGNRNQWEMAKVVPSNEILALVKQKYPFTPIAPQYTGEVASRFAFNDGSGEFGLISSVTQPFCHNCTRGRITCDGTFYTCLFTSKGLSLKPLLDKMASKENIAETIFDFWKSRTDKYSEDRNKNTKDHSTKKIEMNHIGG